MATTATLPFPVASRVSTRLAFDNGPYTLNAANSTPVSPIIIPAVGYEKSILLEVTGTVTGGTTPAYVADAPFSALSIVNLKAASGTDIVTPITGYQLYLANKYGGYKFVNDCRNPVTYSATPTGFHYFIRVPLEIDPVTGLGAIPAMASNRSYQLNLTLAPVANILSGAPTVTLSIRGYSEFWLDPAPNAGANGQAQAVVPQGLGTLSIWQIESPSVNPGDRIVKLNNVGNILRSLIFTVRNSSGVRVTDGNGWPTSGEFQFLLDNEIDLAFPVSMWQQYMMEWFGLNSATNDAYQGLDTGVYVIPFHAFNSSHAGDPSNTRSQLLPTMGGSQVEVRATFGSATSSLEILSNIVKPAPVNGFADIFAK